MRRLAFPQLVRLPVMGALVAATATVLAAGPAAAGPGFGPHLGGPHTNAGNWAGYAAAGSANQFKSITGSWKEPVVKCTRNGELAAPWIGLDGYGTQTVEQTGAAFACSGKGTPAKYEAWYEMYPASPHYFSNPVKAGDTFNASVTWTGGHTYKLVLTDATQGWTHTETKTLSSAKNASAEAILEAPGGFPTMPNGVTFTNVEVNGKLFSASNPTKLTATGGFRPGPLNGGTFTIKHT
jgi:hypothetical protein